MSRSLQVAGYDKLTERLAVSHPLPQSLSDTARELARVGEHDDGGGIYPLREAAAFALSVHMRTQLNTNLYDWFLEASDEQAS